MLGILIAHFLYRLESWGYIHYSRRARWTLFHFTCVYKTHTFHGNMWSFFLEKLLWIHKLKQTQFQNPHRLWSQNSRPSFLIRWRAIKTFFIHFCDEIISSCRTHGRGFDNPVVWREVAMSASGRRRVFETPLELCWLDGFPFTSAISSGASLRPLDRCKLRTVLTQGRGAEASGRIGWNRFANPLGSLSTWAPNWIGDATTVNAKTNTTENRVRIKWSIMLEVCVSILRRIGADWQVQITIIWTKENRGVEGLCYIIMGAVGQICGYNHELGSVASFTLKCYSDK